jgi:hypothetical protein
MSQRRVGCVARRIIEKMHVSFQNLSVEELAVHVYGDATAHSRFRIRRTVETMTLPKGWGQQLGRIACDDVIVTGLCREVKNRRNPSPR